MKESSFAPGSGEPLSRVQVTLRRIPDRQENEIPRLLTQDDGKFSFGNLEPGQFELTVARNGYARQSLRSKNSWRPWESDPLFAEGQALKGITFRMVQGGVISGRIRDFRGEAVAGYQVFLMKSEYTADGKRRLTDAAAGTVTDDRGEYRLYWIPPGRYYLLASQFLKEKKDGLGPDVVPDQVFPTSYYPGVADLPRAVTIEIRPGAELGAMDIVLPQPAVYRIRGRVISSTGRPPPQIEMGLSPRSITGAVVDDRKDFSTSYDSATGRFEVRNVVPGEYWLGAFMYAGKAESLASVEPPTLGAILEGKMSAIPSAAGQVPVNVSVDSNDVVLTLDRGITVPVRLHIEGDPSPVARDLNEIEVGLRPTTGGLWETGTPQIKPDGTSTISRVLPGDYRVVVHIPESLALYTREAIHQRTDVLSSVWQVTSATSGPLDVILSSRGGQIEGTVRDS